MTKEKAQPTKYSFTFEFEDSNKKKSTKTVTEREVNEIVSNDKRKWVCKDSKGNPIMRKSYIG